MPEGEVEVHDNDQDLRFGHLRFGQEASPEAAKNRGGIWCMTWRTKSGRSAEDLKPDFVARRSRFFPPHGGPSVYPACT